MRKLAHTLITIFVIFSLFVIKDDLKIVYGKVLSYIEENKKEFKITDFQNFLNDIKLPQNLVENSLDSKISTPGPLKVSDVLLDSSKKNLTISGVIQETNRNRVEFGNLPPLIENQKLNISAEQKMNDMFSKQYFEHISPIGEGVDDVIKSINYEYILVGENLAMGIFRDNKDLVEAWMASPGHRANILNDKYLEIGVAVGYGDFEGKNVWLAVQHFGVPRDVCPEVDNVLKGIIDLDQKNINQMITNLTQKYNNIESGAVVEGKTTTEQIITYNDLVKKYNKIISELKEKISTYNNQVRTFNECLKNFTGE